MEGSYPRVGANGRAWRAAKSAGVRVAAAATAVLMASRVAAGVGVGVTGVPGGPPSVVSAASGGENEE